MGKVWGYDDSSGRAGKGCPGGRFSKHKIGPEKTTVFMKIPDVYDIQRQIFARQLMYISQVEVYKSKSTDLQFEEKVKEYKRRPLAQRVPYYYGLPKSMRGTRDTLPESTSSSAEIDYDSLLFKRIDCRYLKAAEKDSRETCEAQLAAGVRVELTEDWQRQHWQRNIKRDLTLPAFYEILGNHRMVSEVEAEISPYQPLVKIFMESARHGLKTHNWAMVCKALSGIIHEYPKNLRNKLPGIVWTMGFLAIIHHHKNTQPLKDFAVNVQTLLRGFPAWTGIQLGIWLIQQGQFPDGLSVVEASYNNLSTNFFRQPMFLDRANPKRDMTIFIAELIRAVHLYSEWKRAIHILRENPGNSLADEDSIMRSGESTLAVFEEVYHYHKLAATDVMCFLGPFVELLVEYRSVNRAKEIVQEVYVNNDGNWFVERFYMQFLEKYFHTSDTPSEEFLKTKKRFESKFTFSLQEGEWRNSRRRLRRFRAARKNAGKVQYMQSVPVPAYSW